MKTINSIISLLTCGIMLLMSASCQKQSRLASPALEVSEIRADGFTLGWAQIEGATEYVYVLGTESEQRTAECSVSFDGLAPAEYNVKVKATGTGYLDSEWGEITVTIDDASLAMKTTYVSDGCFNIEFTPGEGLSSITTVSIERDSIGPYAVYAKGITAAGIESGTAYSQIMAFSAGLTVDNFDLVAMDLTATVHDESIASSGLLVVSKSVLGELGMSIEELTEMYASFGMVTPIANGEKGIVALNGYENYDYIMGVAGFDASGNYVTCGSFSFHSDFADENLPLPEEMVIEVSEITESNARVQYIMGENTRAYYQSVMTVADYNDLLAYGASLPDDYDDPEDYVRDYVAVYGTTMFADDDHVWPSLSPGTDYIAVGYPMNGNGTFGYGETAKTEFTTAGTAPASVKGQSPAPRKTNVIRPLTLQEIKEVLGK